jgi:hypothetical protein
MSAAPAFSTGPLEFSLSLRAHDCRELAQKSLRKPEESRKKF